MNIDLMQCPVSNFPVPEAARFLIPTVQGTDQYESIRLTVKGLPGTNRGLQA